MRAPLLIGGLGFGAAVLVFALLRSPSPTTSGEVEVPPATEGVDLGDREALRSRIRDLKARGAGEAPASTEPINAADLNLSPQVEAALDKLPEDKRQERLRKYEALRRGSQLDPAVRAERLKLDAKRMRGRPFWQDMEKRRAATTEEAASED